jgi:4-deoxy-L-threo-5-hexosulose-uronate ketol-isomerase
MQKQACHNRSLGFLEVPTVSPAYCIIFVREYFKMNGLLINAAMKTNYEIRYAAHPEDAKQYDTARLRRDFLIEKLFEPDEVQLVYSMYDRMIAGGAMPVKEKLRLEAIPPLKQPFFLRNREIGIYHVGGSTGMVHIGDDSFELQYKEALYLGSGDRELYFESTDPQSPSLFYFNSTTAHRNRPDKKITRNEAVIAEMGAPETSNHRHVNKMIVNQVLPTCQLQMGMTELAVGSVWNTMPAHIHSRRMEVYFYFEVPEEQAVCHFMGEPFETRHIWMKGRQAVLSPEWSIHSAAATSNYTFIWGMGGENLDYGDQDFFKITELK